jgi:flagellar hook-associated protein 1 FlgK
LVDQLSKLASVRTIERGNGTIGVFVESALLVDGTLAKPLTAAGEPPVVTAAGSNLTLSPEGSVIGELVATLTTRIPGVQVRLDALAGALVAQTNALHTAGFLADGTPGTNFFDPAATTARDINVVATAATLITSDAALQPNNNRIALAMANMRTRADQNDIAMGIWTPAQAALLGGVSAGEHYRTTIADLAVETRLAEDSHTVFSTLEEQLALRRKSVSGVSTDEEMIRVMQYQQGYAAAARLVNVVDEMFQTVLDLKR